MTRKLLFDTTVVESEVECTIMIVPLLIHLSIPRIM